VNHEVWPLVSVQDAVAARVGIRFDFDPTALAQLADEFNACFERVHGPVDARYQNLLYQVAHAFQPEHLRMIDALFGLQSPRWGQESELQTIAALDAMRYPDTRAIARIRAVPELTLPTLSHYLHFFHHTYPIYDRATCAGLQMLGIEIPYTKMRDADVYGLYVAAIETLKEVLPYWCFPERNLSLQRVTQAALAGYGTQLRNG
jgi:hypothetical protein